MVVDKRWLSNPDRTSTEYNDGINSFLEMCNGIADHKGCVFCPCNSCKNSLRFPLRKVKRHLIGFGFWRMYTVWSYHGENLVPQAVVVDDIAAGGNMGAVLEDLRQVDTNMEEVISDMQRSDAGDDFYDLLKELQSELYPGSTKTSSLDYVSTLMHFKVKHKWTNSSFTEVLAYLKTTYPEGNKAPESYYQAKKTLKKIGMGYESIHVCKYDCALFWKEHTLLNNCPVCNESRWVDTKTKGKQVAKKVLKYFPLTPRLRRLYYSRHTAKDMIWHNTGRSEEGTMRHPVDGSSWKEFDVKYPDFSSEARNVRLGLAADGFNPFGNMSSAYSTWPVVLTTYNLPPWLCMKESSFMLSLLIPGPKSPAKDMDVFLRPLVDELKDLWQFGVRTKDAATNTFFTMKASLLWTINDFPARTYLSGWSGQGYLACPTCNEDTPSTHVQSKTVYVGHRRFLDANHPWRTNLEFNGEPETRGPPKHFSEADIKAQHDLLVHHLPGKHPNFGGVKRKSMREDFELNWNKRSIFFELEYWFSLELKHNLDVMHIERNVCDNLLGTLLMNDKTKDTVKAHEDLEKLNIRETLWMKKNARGKSCKPHPKYSLTVSDRKLFCKFIKDVKLPDGFGSNISARVVDNNTNITGLKAHDCHILMQSLLLVGVKGFLAKDTYTPIVGLCMFFKQLCSRTLLVEDMKKAKDAIIKILCQLELIYPPAFFDIMVHLVLHLPDEAIRGGPVCTRWMYPFERYMKKLKGYVRNKARPDGCIAEGYVAEEALSFCSRYLEDVQTQFNRPDRNEDVVVEKRKMWVFKSLCHPYGADNIKYLSVSEKLKLEWFVLDSCEEVRNYMNEFKSEQPQLDVKTEFPKWFREKVYLMKKQNSQEFHSELYALSMGANMLASTYTACAVNGVRFMVLDRDARRTTQNYGVSVDGEDGTKYYGQLEEIIQLYYPNKYSTVLFRCKWFDTQSDVRFENNITSINTRNELDKEDQLIFASQAKHVFYIKEPSRNQNNNHRWVVEHVNHRRVWDLPLTASGTENVEVPEEENLENIRHELSEDLDILHNNSSSAINLFIDFTQYFPSSFATQDEAVEVSEQQTVVVSTLSEGENGVEISDESESDSEVSEGEMSD